RVAHDEIHFRAGGDLVICSGFGGTDERGAKRASRLAHRGADAGARSHTRVARIRRVRRFLIALAAVAAAGCAQGRTVVPVRMQPAASLPSPVVTDLSSYEATVRTVAGVITRDVGLPLPETVMVYVYSSRQVFEEGLVADGQVSRVRAAELSDFAIGVGKRRQLRLHHAPSARGLAGDVPDDLPARGVPDRTRGLRQSRRILPIVRAACGPARQLPGRLRAAAA